MKRKSPKSKKSKYCPCPLCESDSECFVKSENREYWLCGTCRLIFVPAVFHMASEDEVERYLEHENSLENEGYVNMFRKKINVVRKHCGQVQKVLDYGCGYEPVLKTLLSREGFTVDGYDLNFFPEGLTKVHYDLIISTETFEHFREPRKEISKIVPLLSDSGFVAVMTRFYPKEKNGASKEGFQKWYYKRDPSHIAFYSTDTFQWIAYEKGLDIIFNNDKDFVIFQSNASKAS